MEGAIQDNTIVIHLVRVVFRCGMAERLVLLFIMYDIVMPLTNSGVTNSVTAYVLLYQEVKPHLCLR